MSNVNYSFVQDSQTGELTFQSKVHSFGIDHVTEKDLVSFYRNFSKSAYFDSGLLPVDGSGLLSIRSAGAHTQIGYQHKPGMYYINWGGYENDPNADKIYVAQPYRIVIADLYNGNILGARTFYSPIPVCHPDTPLYHVNLPNINCKGYRGNGVGWICLYHNEDISSYPFNEKIAKILDRCSGTEAYNDANMSETDGPRFYRERGKSSHIWNPQKWEEYSDKNGTDWTLDPDLWIPVLVTDIDHQDKHVDGGMPLTYAGAVLGDYQAYYTDPIRPKPVNKVARDSNFDSGIVFDWFKVAYNASNVHGANVNDLDSFLASTLVRENQSQAAPIFQTSSDEDEDDDDDYYVCDYCSEAYNSNKVESYELDDHLLCIGCYENHTVYIEHLGFSMLDNTPGIEYNNHTEMYYFLPDWDEKVSCDSCATDYIFDKKAGYPLAALPLYQHQSSGLRICTACSPVTQKCSKCETLIMAPSINADPHIVNDFTHDGVHTSTSHSAVCNDCYVFEVDHYATKLFLDDDTLVSCICGEHHFIKNFVPVDCCFKNMKTFFCPPILPSSFEWGVINGFYTNHNHTNDNLNIICNSEEHSSHTNAFPIVQMSHPIAVYTKFVCPSCTENLSQLSDWHEVYDKWLPEMISKNLVTKVLNEQNVTELFGTTAKFII